MQDFPLYLGIIVHGPYVWVFYLEIPGSFDTGIDIVGHIYLIINKKTTKSLIMERRKNNKIHPRSS